MQSAGMNSILTSNTMLRVIAWRHEDVSCHYSVILALKLAQEDYPLTTLMVFIFSITFNHIERGRGIKSIE